MVRRDYRHYINDLTELLFMISLILAPPPPPNKPLFRPVFVNVQFMIIIPSLSPGMDKLDAK